LQDVSVEITAPAILLAVAPFGEGDAVATLFTETDGLFRGLARGAQSRKHAATWQPGNLLQIRWIARLEDQLGSVAAELVHPAAALVMHDAFALAVLSAACAVAEGALPERQPQPAIFRGLLHVIAHAGAGQGALPDLVQWELGLLRELGYGLDLTACAVTGATGGLAYVSPKSGRAVSAAAAGRWIPRLLPLPAFLTAGAEGDIVDWADGLQLTGHFLARAVFAPRNRPLPAARAMLADRAIQATRRTPSDHEAGSAADPGGSVAAV
jgi:DNA repair protein RecO (recombination protein O)